MRKMLLITEHEFFSKRSSFIEIAPKHSSDILKLIRKEFMFSNQKHFPHMIGIVELFVG